MSLRLSLAAKQRALDALATQIKRCRRCHLWQKRRNAVPGEGPADAKIVLIGEAPGRSEDALGKPFVGMAGRFLNTLLNRFSLNRATLFITSPLKCWPGRRRPSREELMACRPWLEKQLLIIQPKLVALLGDVALKSFFPNAKLNKVHGKRIERRGVTLVPTFHPAAGMRFPKIRAAMIRDFKTIKELAQRLD